MAESSYQQALSKLPQRVLTELKLAQERFLPLHEDDDEKVNLRAADDVAKRALVLLGVLTAVQHSEWQYTKAWLHAEGLWESVTEREQALLAAEKPSAREAIGVSWWVERLCALLWALGRIPEMGSPVDKCDYDTIDAAMQAVGMPVAGFVDDACLRPTHEILDQLSITWQIHAKLTAAWIAACGQERTVGDFTLVRPDPNKKPPPALGGVDPGVVLERLKALNWLVHYCLEEWDDVSADT